MPYWPIAPSGLAEFTEEDVRRAYIHGKPAWVAEKDVLGWVEYSNSKVFRDEILKPLHKVRLVEYDEIQHRVRISPLGIKDVEERILQARTP